MKENKEYTRDEMLRWLEEYFNSGGYEVDRYSDRFLPARVPLYCEKKEGDKTDEVVIEITTDKVISKDEFFRPLTVEGIRIMEASPARFYQYYFPKAKIYFAYPDYAEENDEFNGFKELCAKRGIGLLKAARRKKGKIEKVAKSRPLFDEICNQLSIEEEDTKKRLEYHLRNCLHYFVYYPESVFKRRAITGRMQQAIGFVLIDQLLELNNIIYKDKLRELASNYRQEARDDYDIALKYIGDLWRHRLGLEYPEIQRHLEEILLRDEMYREHFVHQFQVFLIGAYILDKLYDTKVFSNVIQSFKKKYRCEIEDAWLAASTYHDFNYGLQNFDIWLLQFFSNTLSIKNEEAKQNLNTLNLDAAMVREFLLDIIIKMIALLNLDENAEKTARKFFYEKAVRDKNHGLLSALSILKLCEIQKSDLKVSFDVMLQAAFAIACHDEDIWEALCGCTGYLRSNLKCEPEKCGRKLPKSKYLEVHKRNISNRGNVKRCEIWEEELMDKAIIKKIKFDKNPLLFLLIYCDSVQEEGRITSLSFGNTPTSNHKEFRIRTKDSTLNDWAATRKKLGKFEQAGKIRNAFTAKDYELSDEARIYALNDQKWKIVDENLVYQVEKEKKSKTNPSVRVRRKECSLSKISVGPGKIDISLIIDGLENKRKELERVSWALEDKSFKVHLREKDTKESVAMTINGSGGG